MEAIIQTHGITKLYGENYALKDVSVTINRGDIYGLIGGNGAGKTTLIRIIAGLVKPTSGHITLAGDTEPAKLALRRSRMGCIVETPALYLNMTALDCMKATCLIFGRSSNKASELLEIMGLSDVGSKRVGNFSLGMKQRLSLAQTMITEPEILILDEPTNGMDPYGISEIRKYLKHLAADKGVTILVSSHILSELQMLATRFGIIEHGVIIDQFAEGELAGRGKRATFYVSDLVSARGIIASIGSIDHVVFEKDGSISCMEQEFSKIIAALSLAGITFTMVSLQGDTNKLESYYISKVGR